MGSEFGLRNSRACNLGLDISIGYDVVSTDTRTNDGHRRMNSLLNFFNDGEDDIDFLSALATTTAATASE